MRASIEVRSQLSIGEQKETMNMTQVEKIADKFASSQDSTIQNRKNANAREVIKEFGIAPGGKPYFQEFKDDLSKM